MQLQQLQTLVNYRRRDATENFISNDEITAYLNEALRKATSNYEYDWNKVSTSFSYTTGGVYALSAIASDLDEPINIFFNSSYQFQAVSPQEFKQLSASNYNIWAIDNGDLMIKTSFGAETLTLNYYTTYVAQTSAGSRVSGLSASDDSPLLPEQFQDLLVDFASSRCYQKEGMYDDYKIAYNDYLQGLKNIKAKIPSRKKHYSKVWQSNWGRNNTTPSKANVLG